MEDREIVALYLNRDERALVESETKYGKYCRTIARNILQNREDALECCNDVLLRGRSYIGNADAGAFKRNNVVRNGSRHGDRSGRSYCDLS